MTQYYLILTLAILSQVAVAQDLADLFEVNKYSVVTIYTSEDVNTGSGDPRTFASNMGLGSGVFIRDNYILTAAHVVGNAKYIMVEFFGGERIPALTYRISKIADVAIIKLEKSPSDAREAVIGNSDDVRVGDEVFVIGAPMGLTYSLSRGIISGRESELNPLGGEKILEFFQTDAAINTGNSGGPMFNSKGEVIGIVSSILSRSGGFEGIGFAATSQVARDVLNARSSLYFGIDALSLTYEMAVLLNVPQESGWLIQNVVEGSPAGSIGLRGGFRKAIIEDEEILLGGDIILQVGEVRITEDASIFRIAEYLDAMNSTTSIPIKLLRAGKIMELNWINTGL